MANESVGVGKHLGTARASVAQAGQDTPMHVADGELWWTLLFRQKIFGFRYLRNSFMLTLRMLRTLQSVARTGSFVSAAERVSLTQAAVSQQMRMIEEALGRKLFDRRGRQIALTNEGHEVCAKVERILTLIDGLYTTQDESMDGQVSIGAVVSVIGALSLAIAGLKREHPALDVRLTSARSNELAQMVLDGEIDMAAVVEHTGETLTENLVWTPLYDEPLILVASSEVSDDDPRAILSASSYLGFDRRVRTGVIIERALQTLGLGVREYLELNSIETIVSLVRNNVGVSVLPLLRGAGWQTDPLLRILPLCAPALTRSVGIVQRKSHVRTRLTQAISAALIAP